MHQVYIVIDGGCVRYVSTNKETVKINVTVLDLDDMKLDPKEDDQALLREAETLPRIW